MNIKYKVMLTPCEEMELKKLTSQGKASARKIKRAQILLLSHKNTNSNREIAEMLRVSVSTIYRTRQKFVEESLTHALEEGSRSGQPKKLDGNQEALLIATACSKAPKGNCRWTLSLLRNKMIALTNIENISIETIRKYLKKNDLKPWQKKMWCIKKLNATYIARMEAILDLYAEPENPKRPVVNFDEAGKQLVEEVNAPYAPKPGSVAKEDYEYKRAGMANIFMFFDRHKGWRKVKVTEGKTAIDFAHCMSDLVDKDYPEAEVVRVVLDNFSTHTEAALYKAFTPEKALRILRRLEFHYTPKHASWLNMAEIEIGNMNQQCLNRRIATKKILREELAYWQEKRNREKASINWMFDVNKAREKLDRAYASLIGQN